MKLFDPANPIASRLISRLVGLEQWHDYAHMLYCDEQKRTGASFKAYRTASKVAASRVAKEMEVSPMFVSDLERGNRLWHEPMARKYLAAVDKLRGNDK